jgi:hypothetical protein
MQTIRPNSGLNYHSLDIPFNIWESYLPDRKFKYNHFMRLNSGEFNIKVGDLIKQRKNFRQISIKGGQRDGFFVGTLIKPNATKQIIRFPLYKTVEEYLFYRN